MRPRVSLVGGEDDGATRVGAAEETPGLAMGFTVVAGKVTYPPVAAATDQPYVELSDVLGAAA